MSVFEIFSFRMHSILYFSHFVFKCRKHNYFCCDFLLGFVANFEKLNGFELSQVDYFVSSYLADSAF